MSNDSVTETEQVPSASEPKPSQAPPSTSPSQPQQQQQPTIQGPTLGPILGPSLGPSLPEPGDPASVSQVDPNEPPKSPYTANRDLIYSLTLPSIPNTSIPPSPPGSPPQALTAKFDNFLSLKSNPSNPIHFNARLASSSAVKNPGLMDKLLGFVGVEGKEQYRTTLGPECGWDPEGFPAWAFKGGLRRAADRAAKERERKVGERVEFVGATKSEDGTVAGGAGLGAPMPVTGKRKTRFEG